MFEGFCPETIDFLWGLRMNNNRDWFMEHKSDYRNYLLAPMKEFAAEISEPFIKEPGIICKTSRIYKDMRIPQAVPYKESLWICIRRSSEWWLQEPSLCFEITPDGYSYGFLFWEPGVQIMNKLRADMAQNPDRFLRIVRKAEKTSGMKIEGKSYVREKPCPDKRLKPYYNLRNMLAIREEAVSEKMFSPELAVTVRETLQTFYPLMRYCQKFSEPETTAEK